MGKQTQAQRDAHEFDKRLDADETAHLNALDGARSLSWGEHPSAAQRASPENVATARKEYP